jgi:flagella accessory protein D or E (flaD/E)
MENNCNFWPFNLGGKKMANTKKIDIALASKMAQVEFDYVEDKASAFLMFNDMLELFRNVYPDGSLEQGQMYLVGDSFVATTSVKVGETYLAKDIVGVASPDDMKAKVETTPMLALRRSRAAALIAAGFGLPFEIREAKKAEYEKEHGVAKEKQPEVQEETDSVEKSNVVELPKATEETKEVPVEEQPEEKPKKRRGRPRKQQTPVKQEQPEEVVETAVEAEEQPIEVEVETEAPVEEKTDEVALDALSEEVSLFDVTDTEDKEESTEEQAAVTETNEVQEVHEVEDAQSNEEETPVVDESSDLLTNMDAGQAETVRIDFIEESNEDVPVSEVKAILPEQPESMELLPEKSPKEIMAEVGKALPEYVDVSISYGVAKAKVVGVIRRPSTDVTYKQLLSTLEAVKNGNESEYASNFTCVIRWLLNQAYAGQQNYTERKADIDAALQLYVNNIELFDELFVKYKAEA